MQGYLVQPCVNVVDCVNLDSEFPIFFIFLFLRVLIFADMTGPRNYIFSRMSQRNCITM